VEGKSRVSSTETAVDLYGDLFSSSCMLPNFAKVTNSATKKAYFRPVSGQKSNKFCNKHVHPSSIVTCSK
jgi:hypothetical protein